MLLYYYDTGIQTEHIHIMYTIVWTIFHIGVLYQKSVYYLLPIPTQHRTQTLAPAEQYVYSHRPNRPLRSSGAVCSEPTHRTPLACSIFGAFH